jgi:hypothetical protein
VTARILPKQDFNSSPPEEKRPARRRPITTLKPRETVRISLRGKHANTLNAWVGAIEPVDGVTVRIEASARRFDLYWEKASGIIVIPWATITHVDVQADGE